VFYVSAVLVTNSLLLFLTVCIIDLVFVVGNSLELKKKVQKAYRINYRDYFSSCRYYYQCGCFVQYFIVVLCLNVYLVFIFEMITQ